LISNGIILWFAVRDQFKSFDRSGAVSLRLDLDDGETIKELISRPNGLFALTDRKIVRLKSPDDLDPKKIHPDAPWEQSVYIPHGLSDEIVARTVYQTKILSDAFLLDSNIYFGKISDVSWDLMNSLISLRFIRNRLKNQIDRIIKEINSVFLLYTSGLNPKPLPFVEYYDIEFRSFVNEVRRVLTKISDLFSILTPFDARDGHFHKALKWAIIDSGQDGLLASMLRDDLRWISVWIDMRIAIEHPKPEKYVETLNFGLEPDRSIRLPTWRFIHPSYDMGRPQNLLEVFEICINNILKFFEDLQILLFERHKPAWLGVQIDTIEENQRDPLIPLRFRIRSGLFG
jgi:hypothetical protein